MANINIPEANPVGSTGVSGVSPIKYTSRGTETGQAIQNLAGSLVNAGVTFAKVKQDVNTKEAKLFIDDRLKNATFELDQITSEEEVEDYTRSFVDSLNEEVHEKYGNKLGYKTIDMYNRQVQSEFQVKSRYKERGILVDKGRALTSTEIEQAVLNYDKEKVKQIAKSARDNGYINNVEMEKMQNQATYEIDINEAINISRDALEADPYLSIINSDNEILSAKSIEESLLSQSPFGLFGISTG